MLNLLQLCYTYSKSKRSIKINDTVRASHRQSSEDEFNFIRGKVAQAAAGAAEILALADKGGITLEAAIATVNEALCQGCGRCEEICEFHAPKVVKNERWLPVSTINEALCKSCGACAVVCPTGAISVRHFARKQISRLL